MQAYAHTAAASAVTSSVPSTVAPDVPTTEAAAAGTTVPSAPRGSSSGSELQGTVDQGALFDSVPRATNAPVALRFISATAAGDHLVCTPSDQQSGAARSGTDSSSATTQHFLLPVDERLRAAIASGTGRATEWENPMTPQLRPKEIQNRIRAGASVDQVAAAAGCAVERIEGFAYPVLLERATVAEKARATFPLRGAPLGSVAAANAGLTLEEIAVQTLTDRGQQHDLTWDAFRDERGWTVTLTWTVGRTENRAEWAYTAQPSGDSIAARNAEAADLLEPSRGPLREVGGTSREVPQQVEPEMTAPAAGAAVAGSLTGSADVEPAAVPTAPATPAPPTRRGHRAPMPSWEDVLLGTRGSQAGGHR